MDGLKADYLDSFGRESVNIQEAWLLVDSFVSMRPNFKRNLVLSSLFLALLRAICFISYQVRSISLALLLCLTNSTYAENFCAADVQAEALLPDFGLVADWGIRVNQIVAKDYHWQDVEVHQRLEIEYEQDVRVTYDQEEISITSFWEGCESFIGKQELCASDESLSIVVTPDQLNDALLSQGSLVTNTSKNITSFSDPYEGMWQVSDNPVLEKIFNVSMTESEVDALGDFTQLGFRQAIRITVDVGQKLDQLSFNDLQHAYSLISPKKGFYLDSKVILKAFYITDGIENDVYRPFRGYLKENISKTWCAESTCGIEYLSDDFYTKESIVKQLSEWSSNESMCEGNEIMISGLYTSLPDKNVSVEKVVFHYEIQTSIINSNNIDNFNPLGYLERDLTLTPKKDAGSLYYLLSLFSILILFRRNKPSRLKKKTPTT